MDYIFNNNGIEIKATYSDEEINRIFIPLLEHLSDMHAQKNKRLLIMLAAPPGAGKSTLSSFLEHLAADIIPDKKVQAIGMDGFHCMNDLSKAIKEKEQARFDKLCEEFGMSA